MMNIYFSNDIRKIDSKADADGLSIFTLMENSGQALFREVSSLIKREDEVGIIAGQGNNGGDAIVLARLLLNHGYKAMLILPFGLPKSEVAQQHFSYFITCGYPYTQTIENEYDVLVDGLFGIGFKPPFSSQADRVLAYWNQSLALKIAIDIPSGVEADRGNVVTAFKADYTLCLHGVKPSAFLVPSADYYGIVKSLDIGLIQQSGWRVWTEEDVKQTWPVLPNNPHKGSFGTGLLIAGSEEMPGCALLSGFGAMRSGIGKLTIATDKSVAQIVCQRLPEATYWYNSLQQLKENKQLSSMKAAAIGPGLDLDEQLEDKVQFLLNQPDLPLILDAAALQKRDYPKGRPAPVILTPHPGELARITGLSSKWINENRISVARDFAIEHEVTVVLKGVNTVIAFPDGTGYINQTGNRGLSKGGSGDTLLGIILGLLCQSEPFSHYTTAVSNAVYLHGKSSEYWAIEREPSAMLATDIMEVWPYLLKELNLKK